ncbi:Diaminopimelate decarboxylase [hydrothermal vent metagenome]|uniref:Diaminopimelate decarboxylase n=1 Tax=hydrothermal vent metagenome TaxID=652676 RepID=A0A3B1C0D2_9ZZZZ
MTPIKLFASKGASLNIGGISIDAIIDRTGSPVYIYDAGIMRRQYRRLLSAMPKGTMIHYSIKANPNMAVVDIFRRLGAGAEVASLSELKLALKVGFPGKKIIFAGPGKSKQEIRFAVNKRIGSINIESSNELARVIEASERKRGSKGPTPVALRVNLDHEVGEAGEAMIGGSRKFGIDEEYITVVLKRAMRSKAIKVTGFHCYAGTQITNSRVLAAAYKRFALWANKTAGEIGMQVETLNFGGGLGIPFGEGEMELDVDILGSRLAAIKQNLGKSGYFSKVRFLLEPGRYLVGPAGVYVSRVTDIKKSGGVNYVITEGGIHHALIPIVLNKNYPTAILNKMDMPSTAKCVIAGPLCSSSDQFSRMLKLPHPEIGDLVGIFNSGAYGLTAGMVYFLSHPTPAEALVEGKRLYIVRGSKRPDHGVMKRLL